MQNPPDLNGPLSIKFVSSELRYFSSLLKMHSCAGAWCLKLHSTRRLHCDRFCCNFSYSKCAKPLSKSRLKRIKQVSTIPFPGEFLAATQRADPSLHRRSNHLYLLVYGSALLSTLFYCCVSRLQAPLCSS